MTKHKNNYSFLVAMLATEKAKLCVAVIFAVLSTLLSYVPYLVVFKVITSLIQKNAIASELIALALWGIAAMILQAVLKAVSGISSHIAAYNILNTIRLKVVEQISKFNLGFFQSHTSGEMKKMVDEDIARIETFIAHNTLDIVSGITAPIAVTVVMLLVSWKMTLALIIPTLLCMLLTFSTMKNHAKLSAVSNEKSGKFNNVVREFVKGMPVIKTYNITTSTFKKYKDTLADFIEARKATMKSSCKPIGLLLVLVDCGLLFTLPFGGWLYLGGGINLASYILFMLLSMNFLYAIGNIMTLQMNLTEIITGVEKVREVLETEPMPDGTIAIDKNVKHTIEFRRTSFSYDETEVLHDIDLTLPSDSLTAFVGTSGAGKSTAAQLLLKFWQVEKGGIFIDDINLNDITTASLMDTTAFVFQDVFLLNDTIMENIRMGNHEVSDIDVVAAAKAAQIHDVITKLPDGYNTKIGAGGVKLSGGEKQRVSIARAILKNTSIVIFDEATSFSDIENEHKIQLALETLLKNKTTIMIAHRLNTITGADNIVVFDNGKIPQQGTQTELLESGGLYKEMWDTYVAAQA